MFLFIQCDKKEHKFTNDLIHETSPYLLQHAHNPVDWKPWSEETLALAEKEQKLIIVSIGYTACHWCHVMEEESFKNDSVAKLMNDKFISIKVDKEERPDINKIYLNAVELMTGNGGWPLNCIALPNGKPIFGGTYFTKKQWIKALNDIVTVYEKEPKKVLNFADKLTEGIKNSNLIELNKRETFFTNDSLHSYVKTWNNYLDFESGGQQTENKFPLPNNLLFQLRYAMQNNDSILKSYVTNTLEKMAFGGIYDQIGGGFSRYAVDKKWHIPHFEKMLYDNAQLVSLYSEAYLATKNNEYKTIVEETLAFTKRELTSKNGAFYASLDADSFNENNELEEGAYYTWTKEELQSILKDDYSLFENYYNSNDYGKWEDNYVFIKKDSDSIFANKNNITINELTQKVANWKKTLSEKRKERKPPRLDDKILTSWNALMAKGYIDAYRVFDNPEYLEIATKNINFILDKQLRDDGGLNHNYKEGKSNINGYLEDYAMLIDALINLYQVTFEEKWLQQAKNLTDYTITHFKDDASQMFFFTSDEDADLISRKIETTDNVIASSNSIMAHNLFKLSHIYADKNYSNLAEQMLKNIIPTITNTPSTASNWLLLMDNFANPYFEVAFSGKNALKKLKKYHQNYLPNTLVLGALSESKLPLMENRFNEDDTFIYVCVDGTCKLPTNSVEKAISQIKK